MSAPFSLTVDNLFSIDNVFLTPSPSSDRPSSACSLPRTVSRPGSWIDFHFEDEPDLGLHRLTSLARELDTSGYVPALSEDEAEGPLKGAAGGPTFERPTRLSQSPTNSSIYEMPSRSNASFDESEDDKEIWHAEMKFHSERRSRIQSHRSGFYGSPSSTPSSATLSLPYVSSSDESANSSTLDLTAVSALSRFVIDLHRTFPMDIDAEPFNAEALNADDALIDDPWLAFEDELLSGLEAECTAVLRTRVVGRVMGKLAVAEQKEFTPRKLSLVPEEDDDDELSESAGFTGNARPQSALDKPLPRLPSGVFSDAEDFEWMGPNKELPCTPSTPRNPHPPVMIAPLITLDEARKRFAHAHSLDLPPSPALSRNFFSESIIPPRRARSLNQKYRLFHLGDKAT
ncbi:hypothetical protein EWM64_g250 [Hericium alpestre]|uniref:Uncharacterized protein n=1 Tax=Hericium alpestre TaxID=135208 RepID=A0A4Z0A9L1_9AGAM|nr:hypothetical protein EWM64_g250 [Hericium alpestre]